MNLFRRREPARTDLVAALERLDRLAEEMPALGAATRLQSAILREIYSDAPTVGTLDIAPARAAEKLRAGVPLLRDERVPLDLRAIESLMLRLCRVTREHGENSAAAAEIGAALERRVLGAGALVREVLAGRAGAVRARAAELGLDGGLLGTLLRFSLLPSLELLAERLAPLQAASRWRQGYCPTCGSWPLLGEYRGLEQNRALRCGLCASEWTIDRLLCPFCGSRDHDGLGYLYAEGDEHRRAATCERCRGYVKILATLTAIPPIELPIYDLMTIHLDMVALERGYAVPS